MASIGRREKVRNANRDQLRVVKSTERPPRRKKHRGISKNAALIERVMLVKFPPRAALPYRSDREVAREVGISVQAVGELVKAGFERGLVSPLYNIPLERREVARLENAVRTRYQLQQVLLVPGLPDMLAPRDVQERRNVHTHVLHSIAPRVVEHLDALLAPGSRRHERFTLGVAWGRTMRMIAEHLHSTPRDFRFPELQVLPIVGITCEALAEPTEANVIAMRFAEAYDGESVQLAHPAFVHRSDLWIGHQRLEQVHRVLQLLPSCQAVLTSMGPIPPHENADEVTLSGDAVLNQELFHEARNGQAVGEICYWAFNDLGEEVKTTHTAIGLGYANLKKIAGDTSRQVILVAGGDQRRFVPLRAALRARLASVLVSDTVTAKFLVDEL